jgi:hypothetical protein
MKSNSSQKRLHLKKVDDEESDTQHYMKANHNRKPSLKQSRPSERKENPKDKEFVKKTGLTFEEMLENAMNEEQKTGGSNLMST